MEPTPPPDRYRYEPADHLTAEKIFEARWALTLLDHAMTVLREEYVGRGKAIHGVLGGFLIGAIAYGVSLLNLGTLSTPLQYILPGGVLLVAVGFDVVSRRGSVTRV